MTAEQPGDPAHALGETIVTTAGEDVAEPPASIQRLYDTALERAAVDGSPASQRYLSVLLAAS